MALPTSLASALYRHAAERPEEPWLFRPEGLDWRWHSYGEMARWVALDAAGYSSGQLRGHLSGQVREHSPGSVVKVPFRAEPAWLSLDLGVQGAGRIAAPGVSWSGRPDSGLYAAYPAQAARAGLRSWRELPPPENGFPADPLEGQGGVAVRRHDGEPTVWSAGDLAAAGEALGVSLEEAAGLPAGGREIAVWSGPPDDPGARAFLSWATLRGAALVLEPDPAAFAATAAWVRPTFFQGSVAALAALRQEVEARPARRWWQRRPPLPFGRLRAVQGLGPDGLPPSEEEFWRGRGVAVLS